VSPKNRTQTSAKRTTATNRKAKIVGGFLFSVVVFLLYILLFGPKDDEAV
jgi:hypothetical protein